MKHKGHLEKVDPDTGEVDDKRVWLVNNQILTEFHVLYTPKHTIWFKTSLQISI